VSIPQCSTVLQPYLGRLYDLLAQKPVVYTPKDLHREAMPLC